MHDEWTYNLGFFFGPGLPRSRGGASGSIAGGARFRPVIVPPPRFRLPSTFGGGASELGSLSSLAFDGMGVELDSDVLSALSGGWTDGDGSALMRGLTSDGNWASRSGGRRSVIILLFFADLDVVLLMGVADDMVVDGVVEWLMKWWLMVVDGGRTVCLAAAHSVRKGRYVVSIPAKLGALDPLWEFVARLSRG